MTSAGIDRQLRATRAARSVALRHGIVCDHPSILQDSNHTVIHLAPAPVVAKVGTSPEEASLADEVRVVWYLASRQAPVVPPSSLLPPGPHVEDGLEMTFWEYCPHAGSEPSAELLGCSLRLLHDALDGYPEPLPPWDRFDGVERVLEAPNALSALLPDDRAFLRRTFRELGNAITAFDPTPRPLHGEPHGANLLLSAGGAALDRFRVGVYRASGVGPDRAPG